jgi:hypothetical protein
MDGRFPTNNNYCLNDIVALSTNTSNNQAIQIQWHNVNRTARVSYFFTEFQKAKSQNEKEFMK